MPDPLVLAADVETELVEKRSRFLTRLHRVEDLDQAEDRIRAARRDHPDARHHCTALVIGARGDAAEVNRSSDDGEPSGTAGMPMLQSLLHAGLVDTLAIVTRYFGGVKLGAGGLMRAYTAAVEQAASEATVLRRTQLTVAELDVPLAEIGAAENAVRQWAAAHSAHVEPTVYSARAATVQVLIEPSHLEALAADTARWSSGRIDVRASGDRLTDVPVSREAG
ncbi:IMPACT family protein [Brachybacterium sp. GCM10030267]|uniref:IMPACT family protein n=1 Tax=Brachybacterium sp. GCM10030267 TaxID=3273381 RepID=UPI00361699B9